jgi:hypothetical protein
MHVNRLSCRFVGPVAELLFVAGPKNQKNDWSLFRLKKQKRRQHCAVAAFAKTSFLAGNAIHQSVCFNPTK